MAYTVNVRVAGHALDTVRELIASADAAQVSACTTPGASVEQCVAAAAPEQVGTSQEAAQAWNTSAYELLGTFEDLGACCVDTRTAAAAASRALAP